jgi:hypothetical protein
MSKLARAFSVQFRRLLTTVPDLLTSTRSISRLALDAWHDHLRPGSRSRFDNELFFGKQDGDAKLLTTLPDIVKARKEVEKLIGDEQARPDKFCAIARATLIDSLENKRHSFKVNSDLMFNGARSPVGPLLDEVLKKTFLTAWCAAHEKRENFSGYAIAGTRGTGKSTMTRLVALLSGLLLPNFQTVFVDLVACRNVPLDHIIREAAIAAGVPEVNESDSMGSVFGKFTESRCGIGLFLDELPELYIDNNKDWDRIHTMLSSTEPTFVMVNGSSSILPAMVRRDGEDIPLLKTRVKVPLVSLNGTKMKVKLLQPFSKIEHYREYFACRRPQRDIMATETVISDEYIRQVHLITGGVLRLIRQTNVDTEKVSLTFGMKSYPMDGSLYKRVYHEIVRSTDAESPKSINIFDMPTISEEALENVIMSFYSRNRGLAVSDEECGFIRRKMQDMVENGTLQVMEMGNARRFTFGQPVHYLLTLRRPVVFISHRIDESGANGTAALLKKLVESLYDEMGQRIDVVCCEDGASQELIRDLGLQEYMNRQCVTGVQFKANVDLYKVAIVLITEAYLKRIEDYAKTRIHNGCADELLHLTKSDQWHVYFFKDENLDRAEAIKRLEDAIPAWKDRVADRVHYDVNSKSVKQLADSILYNSFRGPVDDSAAKA